MPSRIRIAGNVFALKMKNPWAEVNMAKTVPPILMNITFMRQKLAKHPSVVARWEAFAEAAKVKPAECAGLSGMQYLACRAKYIGRTLRK